MRAYKHPILILSTAICHLCLHSCLLQNLIYTSVNLLSSVYSSSLNVLQYASLDQQLPLLTSAYAYAQLPICSRTTYVHLWGDQWSGGFYRKKGPPNTKYGRINWKPIKYFIVKFYRRRLSFPWIVAFRPFLTHRKLKPKIHEFSFSESFGMRKLSKQAFFSVFSFRNFPKMKTREFLVLVLVFGA